MSTILEGSFAVRCIFCSGRTLLQSDADMPEPTYANLCNNSVSKWDFEVRAMFGALFPRLRL